MQNKCKIHNLGTADNPFEIHYHFRSPLKNENILCWILWNDYLWTWLCKHQIKPWRKIKLHTISTKHMAKRNLVEENIF